MAASVRLLDLGYLRSSTLRVSGYPDSGFQTLQFKALQFRCFRARSVRIPNALEGPSYRSPDDRRRVTILYAL